MTESLEVSLAAQLLAMADDEMLLAHRNSEWTGHAPILEEDIAFTNLAEAENIPEQKKPDVWFGAA